MKTTFQCAALPSGGVLGGRDGGEGSAWIFARGRHEMREPPPHASFQHCPLLPAPRKGACHPKPPASLR